MCPPRRALIVYEDDGVVCPGAAAGRQRRAAGAIPLVTARVRPPPEERERAQGSSGRCVSSRQIQGALRYPAEQRVQRSQPSETAVALAQGALHRG